MIGADALLKALENQGVERMFAYPGGAVLPIYDRMPNSHIRRILVRNEQGAAFAAQGYSRVTDEVGVCLATSGPGATNLVTGIADAKLDSIPMVAITGNVFAHLIGSDAFQETDIVGICEPIVKHSYFIENVDDIPRIVAEAFHLAKSGRPGPVLIDIPKNVQCDPLSPSVIELLNDNAEVDFKLPGYRIETLDPNQDDIQKTAELVRQSRRPVVIYGHGVVLGQADRELKDFLEATQIPNTWTLHGIGATDPADELSLGMLGMHGTGTANFAVHNADLIIAIGIRFDDRITGKLEEFAKENHIVHFDIDPSEFNKNIVVDARVLGDVKDTLPHVTKSLMTEKPALSQTQAWRDLLKDKKAKWQLDQEKSNKLTEIAVLNQLFETMDKEAVVTVDVGQHEMWAAQRFTGALPRKFCASGGLGTMGFSLPAAMGAAFAGHETWSISGDGGIQMNIQELGTIAQDNIPVKIVILNNSFLGMVRQWQELFYDKNYVDTPMHNPDFVAVGAAYGIPSFKASTLEESAAILEKMKNHDGPILCEFVLEKEENVFPMVPAGESLGDTLLNPTDKIDTL